MPSMHVAECNCALQLHTDSTVRAQTPACPEVWLLQLHA